MTNLDAFIKRRETCPFCGYQLSTQSSIQHRIEGDNLVFTTYFSGNQMTKNSFSYKLHIYINRYNNSFVIDVRNKYDVPLDTLPVKRMEDLVNYYHNKAEPLILIRDCSNCKGYQYVSQDLHFNFWMKEITTLHYRLDHIRREVYFLNRFDKLNNLRGYWLVRMNENNFVAHVGKIRPGELSFNPARDYLQNIKNLKTHLELPSFDLGGKSSKEIMQRLDMLLLFS